MAEGSDCRHMAAAMHFEFNACSERIYACVIAECMHRSGDMTDSEKASVQTCKTAADAVSTVLDIVGSKGERCVARFAEVLESLQMEHRNLAKRFGYEAEQDTWCDRDLNSPKTSEYSSVSDKSGDAKIDKLMQKLSGIVMDRSGVRWDDVVGLEAAKQALQAALLMPLQFSHLFESTRSAWHGILLFGPPGAGKTYLAQAVAEEVQNYQFISAFSSDLVSKCHEGHRLVASLFELAKAKQPCIIFMDDIDLICGSRESDAECVRSVRSELLNQMAGLLDCNANVMVLAATNVPWTLDMTVRKKFEKKIYVPLPDEAARSSLIQRSLGKSVDALTDADFSRLSKDTHGYSASDLICLVKSALMAPVREICKATHFLRVQDPSRSSFGVPIDDMLTPCSADTPGAVQMSWTDAPSDRILERSLTRDDLFEAISNMKPSIDHTDILNQEEFARQYCDFGSR